MTAFCRGRRKVMRRSLKRVKHKKHVQEESLGRKQLNFDFKSSAEKPVGKVCLSFPLALHGGGFINGARSKDSLNCEWEFAREQIRPFTGVHAQHNDCITPVCRRRHTGTNRPGHIRCLPVHVNFLHSNMHWMTKQPKLKDTQQQECV